MQNKTKKNLKTKSLKSKTIKNKKSLKLKSKKQKGGASSIFKNKKSCVKSHPDILTGATETYTKNKWGKNFDSCYSGSSGDGSKLPYNLPEYIPLIKDFLNTREIKSVVDLGCGDFVIGPYLYEGMELSYTGYDAYYKIIECHKKKYIDKKKPQMPYLLPSQKKYKAEKEKEIASEIEILNELNDKLKNVKLEFINNDFTKSPETLVSADLCIIKDVLQHLPNCIVEKFMNYITSPYKDKDDKYKYRYKYMLITNCSTTTPENTEDYRKDIKPFEFSSLSVLRYPLNHYNAEVLLNWGDTKETSLIDFTLPYYSDRLLELNIN
jgi:hypothetical protein